MTEDIEDVPGVIPDQSDAVRLDKVRMNVWVRRNLWESVNDISKEEDMSVTDVVKAALKEYVKRYKEGEL